MHCMVFTAWQVEMGKVSRRNKSTSFSSKDVLLLQLLILHLLACLHRITYSLSRHQSTQQLLRGCQGENNTCKISWVSCNPFYFLFMQHSVTRNNNSSGSVDIHSPTQVQRERPGRGQQRAEIAFKNPSLTLFGRYIANSSLSKQRVDSFSIFVLPSLSPWQRPSEAKFRQNTQNIIFS